MQLQYYCPSPPRSRSWLHTLVGGVSDFLRRHTCGYDGKVFKSLSSPPHQPPTIVIKARHYHCLVATRILTSLLLSLASPHTTIDTRYGRYISHTGT